MDIVTINTDTGHLKREQTVSTYTGASGKVPVTGGDGKLDPSLLPASAGGGLSQADVIAITIAMG